MTPDPVGYRDSSNLYASSGGDPVNGRDPTGRYGEAGHYYTVLYVGLRMGLSFEAAQRLAFYTQAPDEIGRFDAKESWWKSKKESAGNVFRRNVTTAEEAMQHTQRSIHALTGGASAAETGNAIWGALAAPGIPELGLQLHRLGDSFAHRTLDDESVVYATGIGHGREGLSVLSPDTIQRRPALYREYVRTLASTLAMRFGVADAGAVVADVETILSVATVAGLNSDRWYKARTSEDEFLEEEAVGALRALILDLGRRQGNIAEAQRVLSYRPELLRKAGRSSHQALGELLRTRGQSAGLTAEDIARAYAYAVSTYERQHP